MGSWNGTCGLSNLPITYKDKVKAFLLIQNFPEQKLQSVGLCSISEYFGILAIPVNAMYNSYGSIYKIESDLNSNILTKQFKQWFTNKNLVILPRHECEINSPIVNEISKLEDVYECAERGALKLNGKRIAIYLVLEDVYTACLESVKINRSSYEIEYFNESVNKLTNLVKNKFLSKNKKNNTEINSMLLESNRLINSIEDCNSISFYINHLKKSDVDQFIDYVAKLELFRCATRKLRKTLIPQGGQGSQSTEYVLYKDLANVMLEHINKNK